jgi:LPXTG-motif cell wall-anchored protein
MMKTLKSLYAFLMLGLLSLPNFLMAQDSSGTYIDNLNVQDSSYMSQDLLADTEQASSGSNTTVIIIVAVVVIVVVAFLILRKKKKK